jgi:thermitase
MKRFLLCSRMIMMMAALLMNFAGSGIAAQAEGSGDYLPGEVILRLYDSVDLAEVASDYALGPLDQFGSRPIYRMQILDGSSALDRSAALAADPRVQYAEPNRLGRAPEARQQVSWAKGDEGGGYQDQWAVSMIRLAEAHTVTRGAGITVAILDTGVDRTHPVLSGRLVTGYDFVDMDVDPSEEGSHGDHRAFGHGTHVAGLVALVAPEARLMPVRVLDPDGSGNMWILAEGLAYAVNPDGDPTTDDGADVINLSLSTPLPTHLLADLLAAATCEKSYQSCPAESRGAVVIAAAGNSGSTSLEYPAAEGVAGLLSVGASELADRLAPFSNNGSWIHVTAPGQTILSTVPGGEIGVWSGTSMAAPIVAGTAALVRAAHPNLEPAPVVARLLETSADIGGPIPRRIDAAAAVGIPANYLPGEYLCTGALGSIIVDHVLVPEGQTCMLGRTRVLGNIKVESGAVLHATYVNVNGNLQADKATSIHVGNSTFRGSIQVQENSSVLFNETHVQGNLEIYKTINSSMISNNMIGGNLHCKENALAPTGGGNLVLGNKEEQCRDL